jgi:N-acetylmuramoyl-L-alanine amidase
VAAADRVQASLFISLHFNSAFPRQDQAGLETFCLTPVGLPSTVTRDFEDDPGKVFPNNEFDALNLCLAVTVHRALVEGAGVADRGVKRARFMGVLKTQVRPAILIEGGYLSNPEEAGKISRPEYRQQLAEAVSRALLHPWAETYAATNTP